uniref:ATP-dependent helicase Rep n=1 Tax=Brachiaria deflexa-associated circular DNA molecule 2 TaxID=1708506 RepID=A0A0M4G126_9ZZZZ|nr:RepA [Brachiaria deflexa-associated circular DNA molecule 2]ALC76161.1 RepA [Brachiaria deflexa-associated circular DNA molecule 2]
MAYVRHWCFTLNNYTEINYKNLTTLFVDNCDYLIIGKEVGESGTPHLQGYFQLKKKLRFNAVKKLMDLSSVHLEPRRGTVKQAADYCKKEDDSYFEHGTLPEEQNVAGGRGNKRKWLEVIECAEKGEFETIKKEHPHAYLTFKRQLNSMVKCDGATRDKTRGIWISGPAGCGKTRAVMEMAENIYHKNPRNKWWDGYTNQKVNTEPCKSDLPKALIINKLGGAQHRRSLEKNAPRSGVFFSDIKYTGKKRKKNNSKHLSI